MTWVAPRLDEAAARRRFAGGPWRRGLRHLAALARLGGALPENQWKLELFGLPYYELIWEVAAARKPSQQVRIWIDGYEGDAWRGAPGAAFHAAGALSSEPTGGADQDGSPPPWPAANGLPPSLDADAVRPIAELQLSRMNWAAARWSASLAQRRIVACRLVRYPFWACFLVDRRGRYDVRLLDAVGGRPAGAKIKRALLAGLARQTAEQTTVPNAAQTAPAPACRAGGRCVG